MGVNMMKFTKSQIALSVALSLMGSTAMAQEESTAKDVAQDDIEVIAVSGVRLSLKEAIATKRGSDKILDSIAAEDMGKFPDENVAQSLQRVPGISIDRPRGSPNGGTNGSTDGRLGGQYVQIRGLPVDFTQVTLNGRSLASGRSIGRQFSLDVLPSELIGQLDVYKTVSADQLEGGIGGNADIKTRKPLDADEVGFSGAWSAEGVYSELPDSTDPRLSGIVNWKSDDEKFGVLVGVTYSERQTREDEYFSWGNVNFGPGTGDGVEIRPDLATVPGGTNDGSIDYPNSLYPIEPLTQYYGDERTRTGLNAVIEFQPSDELNITFDGLYATFDVDETALQLPARFQFRGPQDPSLWVAADLNDPNGRGVGGIFPFLVTEAVVENDNLVYAVAPQTQFRSVSELTKMESDTLAVGTHVNWAPNEDWILDFDLGYSKGEQSRDLKSVLLQAFADVVYDARNPDNGIPDLYVTGTDLNDPDNYRVAFGNSNARDVKDTSLSFSVDAKYFLDNDYITSLETGVRYTQRSKEIKAYVGNSFTGSNGVPAVLPTSAINLLDFPVDDFLGEAPNANVIRSFVIGDPVDFHNKYGVERQFDSISSFKVEEDIAAAYVKANMAFDVADIPVKGNVGVRAVTTDVEATGALPVEIVIRSAGDFDVVGETSSTGSSYTNVLPSLSLNAELTDEVYLRFGASKTVTRPTLSQLSPRFTFSTTTLTGSAGNPALEPFESDSLDLSLEWYFNDTGLASVALFQKDIDGFVFNSSSPETIAGIDWASVDRPRNAASATINGAELSFQTSFDFLPAPFDGLGMLANYTYTDSDTDFGDGFEGQTFSYTGLSKNVYNLVGYYEKGPASVRLSYNYREKYLLEPSFGFFAGPRHVNDYQQLDLSTSYKINDNYSLTFNVTNLTNERFDRYFNNDESIIATTNFTGRQYFVGIRGTF